MWVGFLITAARRDMNIGNEIIRRHLWCYLGINVHKLWLTLSSVFFPLVPV